ncbi:MAG TPA: ATP-dependent DNA helicase RecG [Candidatus Omnitrophota bacterium]|nr:ATP-dependent DNA helicase RecG [Candidatus Omnitrophota bacterium]
MQEKNTTVIPIRYIKGVGPKKALLFNKLGVENVQDLFYYLPRRYEDRTKLVSISDVQVGEEQGVVGKITKKNVFRAKTGTGIFSMTVSDGERSIEAVWYNMPFMNKNFNVGDTILLYGKVELHSKLQITHPVYELIGPDGIRDSLEIGRIVPIYSLTQDLSQKYMHRTVNGAIREFAAETVDCIPTYVRARYSLADLKFAVENIHFPYSFENLEKAYKRFMFEEFFVLQIIMALRRLERAGNGIKHEVHAGLMSEYEKLFPFEFTPCQKKCISDIEKDMSSEKPMYRLIQGDVGSGKTVVAMYALLLSAKNGYQSVMMAPTEILARQHYITVSQAFMPLGLNVRLLIGGMDEKERNGILFDLKNGEIDIVIGTHSVFQKDIEYKNLGLAIIDEQHKFGVEQRKSLREKNVKADTLVMTATPIPRSLAMTVYGDMDISILKGKPDNRRPVVTYWVDETRREPVYAFLRAEVKKGRQAYVVCHRIKKEDGDIFSAEGMYEYLRGEIFKDLRTALLHGQMAADEKDKVMKDFRDKKYDILVATTVVEVGVDVPNATIMLIEDAGKYGLAQLHQLRGRIGRGEHTSYCILFGDAETDASNDRLEAITATDDGFAIAEKDLDLRGPGEFFGTRQSGLPELKFSNVLKDYKIMEDARQEAFALVSADPHLADGRHAGLRTSINERFRGKVRI